MPGLVCIVQSFNPFPRPPRRAPFAALIVATLALLSFAAESQAAFRTKSKERPGPAIVGFLPDYQAKAIDSVPFELLTDAIYFSITPAWNGDLDLSKLNKSALKDFVRKARRKKVAVHICVGGWGRSGGFAAVSANSVARERFAHELAAFCKKYKLDGADIDWETPNSSKDIKSYNALIGDLSRKFRDKKLRLSISVPARGHFVEPATFSRVDRIHVMAYDHRGPHSTTDAAGGDIRSWAEQGAPRSKLVLGIPFYGRNTARESMAYRELLELDKDAKPETDQIAGFHFNNLATVRRKTALTLQHGYGGVMVWELSQDAKGKNSLLQAIHETVQTSAAPPPPPAKR